MKTKTLPNGGMSKQRGPSKRLPGQTRKLSATKTIPQRRLSRMGVKGKRRRQRLYRDAMALTGLSAEEMRNVDPVEAMQHVLDTSFAHLLFAGTKVSELPEDELWRGFGQHKTPNEWINYESHLRREVLEVTARMLHLGIEDRRARATEILAVTMAPVLEQVINNLRLTPAQRKNAPEIVGKALKQLESGER